MASINFTKNSNGLYEGVFTASGDFNLHLEKAVGEESVVVRQKTAGNKYSVCAVFGKNSGVIDADFTGVVYPKSISVLCDCNPGVAIVTEA